MQHPKQVFICGRNISVVVENNLPYMGSYTSDERKISLSDKLHKDKHPEEIKDTLLHECLEALFGLINCKYNATGKTLYIIDHDTLQTLVVPELLSIIKQIDFGKYKQKVKGTK